MLLRNRIEALERELVDLRQQADKVLVVAVVIASRGLAFTSGELWRHAYAVAPALAEALAAVGCRNPKQLGKFLERARRKVGHWGIILSRA